MEAATFHVTSAPAATVRPSASSTVPTRLPTPRIVKVVDTSWPRSLKITNAARERSRLSPGTCETATKP